MLQFAGAATGGAIAIAMPRGYLCGIPLGRPGGGGAGSRTTSNRSKQSLSAPGTLPSLARQTRALAVFPLRRLGDHASRHFPRSSDPPA